MSHPYLVHKSVQDTDLLLSSCLFKLITEPRRVGKYIQALLMFVDKDYAYINCWKLGMLFCVIDGRFLDSQSETKT